jgi:Resolvase, N terminal domain
MVSHTKMVIRYAAAICDVRKSHGGGRPSPTACKLLLRRTAQRSLRESCANFAHGRGTMGRIISYFRVSTGKQGKSGLGIEAKREAIARFAAAEGRQVLAEFVAVETGKGGADALDDRRPKLAEALAKAREAKAPSWWRSSVAYPAMWRSFPAQWTSGCRSS